MKKYLSLILLLPSVAMATNQPKEAVTYSSALSESMASAHALSKQQQNQEQDQKQAQSTYTDVDNTANNEGVQVSVSTPRARSGVTIKNVPSGGAPNVYSANPCVVSSSARLALVGGSVSGGKQKVDKGCEIRDLIRLAYAGNDTIRGVYLWCSEAARLGQFETREDCLALQLEKQNVVVHVKVSDGHEKCALRAVGQSVIKEYTDDGVLVQYDCRELTDKGS